jgi:hypothetical protein
VIDVFFLWSISYTISDFMLAHTRKLEEKERKYRVKNFDLALHHAHRQASLIAGIGAPFYIAIAMPDVKQIARQKIDRLVWKHINRVRVFAGTNY